MNELKCPHCGEVFEVDESSYASLLKQVHDAEFEKELSVRLSSLEDKAKAEQALSFERLIREHEAECSSLKASVSSLENELQAQKSSYEGKLRESESASELRVVKAVNEQKDRVRELESELNSKNLEATVQLQALKDSYESKLRDKEEMLEYYKDLKARMSTKMVGETLEQHCEMEFEKLRALGFKNVEFGKDNDARTGSKGDYIYREFDENGLEVLSIMFEMKNEMESTAKKHKNSDFFAELDKDRREKKCEYAILVSMLESDSELYNQGIVDVSHRFEKMYVIRPQFFIPIITLLKNAAMKSLDYRRELAMLRDKNIDITRFEEKLDDFKSDFARNCDLANTRFDDAIADIDKAIAALEKTKKDLQSCEKNLRVAGNKLSNVTIRKLTYGNPTMQKMFEDFGGAQ